MQIVDEMYPAQVAHRFETAIGTEINHFGRHLWVEILENVGQGETIGDFET